MHIKQLANELKYFCIKGITPLTQFADKMLNSNSISLETSKADKNQVIKGFGIQGIALADIPWALTPSDYPCLIIGYVLGGHGTLALSLLKNDPTLFKYKVFAEALLGKSKEVHIALKSPNTNTHYHDYLEASINGYAMGGHKDLLLSLLGGTKYIEQATMLAAKGGNTDLVYFLIDQQQTTESKKLLSSIALKGFVHGHHISEAAKLIGDGAPVSLWSSDIKETPHCNNLVNAILLLAFFTEKERGKLSAEIERVLNIQMTPDEFLFIESIHKRLKTTKNVYQAFYQVIANNKQSAYLNQLTIDELVHFIDEHDSMQNKRLEP